MLAVAPPATIVRPSDETAQEAVGPSAVSKASSFPLSRSQTRSVLSQDAETARRPSGVMATPVTQLLWPSSVRRLWPLSRSQTRSVLSSDAETAQRPSGVMAPPFTQSPWPSSVWRLWRLSRSQPRSVLSSDTGWTPCGLGVGGHHAAGLGS